MAAGFAAEIACLSGIGFCKNAQTGTEVKSKKVDVYRQMQTD